MQSTNSRPVFQKSFKSLLTVMNLIWAFGIICCAIISAVLLLYVIFFVKMFFAKLYAIHFGDATWHLWVEKSFHDKGLKFMDYIITPMAHLYWGLVGGCGICLQWLMPKFFRFVVLGVVIIPLQVIPHCVCAEHRRDIAWHWNVTWAVVQIVLLLVGIVSFLSITSSPKLSQDDVGNICGFLFQLSVLFHACVYALHVLANSILDTYYPKEENTAKEQNTGLQVVLPALTNTLEALDVSRLPAETNDHLQTMALQGAVLKAYIQQRNSEACQTKQSHKETDTMIQCGKYVSDGMQQALDNLLFKYKFGNKPSTFDFTKEFCTIYNKKSCADFIQLVQCCAKYVGLTEPMKEQMATLSKFADSNIEDSSLDEDAKHAMEFLLKVIVARFIHVLSSPKILKRTREEGEHVKDEHGQPTKKQHRSS